MNCIVFKQEAPWFSVPAHKEMLMQSVCKKGYGLYFDR